MCLDMSDRQLSLGALEYLANNFEARYCSTCGSRFWTREEQDTCGDAPCAPYSFIGAPVLDKRDVDSMRESYLAFFERHGHTRISPYPVIARWREDVLLVNASIYDFQPLITSGKVPPPANPLTISQPCVRLKDIDTVGKSGRHLTNFEMMAHHAFNYPGCDIYWNNETVMYCDALLQELGAMPHMISYKESPWAGGGNAGLALEVLVGGLELATLVFMDMRRSKSGTMVKGEYYERMENSIVDTGYGLERLVWASNGAPTIYDAVMSEVVDHLTEAAGLEHSLEDPKYLNILAQNARLAGLMNVEASNLLALRKKVATVMAIPVEELVKIVEPVETVYTIADHSRCLMFMLGDGIVPSNVQAGYLARLVIRKVLRLIDGLRASITLEDVIRKQIQNQSAFPRYKDKEEMIVDMVRRETQKYASTIDKGKRLVRSIAERHKGKDFPVNELVKLYDSHGIPPEIVASVSGLIGTRVAVPGNFYSLVAETHEQAVMQSEEDHQRILTLPATYKLYYDEPERVTFEAQVIGIVDDAVILDKTLFYPGGGGQPEDTGYIKAPPDTKVRVTEARLIDQVILHKVSDIGLFSVGQTVIGEIDAQRRLSLARHHTATHILLSSIRQVLGEHIWQEGAQKGVGASRLDVSHYKKVTDEELRRIERIANETVMSDIGVEAKWMDRNEAEQMYGFTLYQGGVPPGAVIRIVKVGTDVQACAGTHMTSTGKVGPLRIIRTERIQDGVERFEFAAGIAAIRYDQKRDSIASECSKTLRVPPEQLPATVNRFFEEWKERGKENEDLKKLSAKFFSLLAEHQAVKEALDALTARDFDKLESVLSSLDSAFETVTSSLPAGKAVHSVKKVSFGQETVMVSTWRIDADIKELTYAAQRLLKDNSVIVLGGVAAGQAHITVAVSKNLVEKGLDAAMIVKEACSMLDGGGGGKPDRAQGGGPRVENVNDAIDAASKFTVARLGKLKQGG